MSEVYKMQTKISDFLPYAYAKPEGSDTDLEIKPGGIWFCGPDVEQAFLLATKELRSENNELLEKSVSPRVKYNVVELRDRLTIAYGATYPEIAKNKIPDDYLIDTVWRTGGHQGVVVSIRQDVETALKVVESLFSDLSEQ